MLLGRDLLYGRLLDDEKRVPALVSERNDTLLSRE
jgi:hypothetical protein